MALVLREDFDAAQLRLCARQSDDADQVRRLLALTAIYDSASRTEAAEIGGVTRQIVRDWVERLNTGGPGALVARKAPGKSPLLTHDQRAALAQAVEDGPTPAIDGVVRWRLVDLAQWDLVAWIGGRRSGRCSISCPEWKAEPRTTRGGQPRYSGLAIATALTLRAVFRLALRQTEGLIDSIIAPLGFDLAVPDHSTLSRRAETLDIVRPRPGSGPVHLLVDSTGLKLCGAGEWLLAKHGTKTRRSWRKLHIAVDAGTGRIAAATVTTNDVDDASQVGARLDQVGGPVVSFTADGAYDQDGVYHEVAARHPGASVIIPPRSSAVPSDTADTEPTMRDRHLQIIAERGRMAWQKASGYNWRALVEAEISRFKWVIGDGLRSRTDRRRATEVSIAVNALNQMLELGRPEYVRLP